MSEEYSMLEWGFKGLVSAALAAGGWLWARLVNSVNQNRDEIAAHKLHVAENYIKKDMVERIHNRIDELAEKESVERLADEIGELRSDIKSILRMMGNGRAKATD